MVVVAAVGRFDDAVFAIRALGVVAVRVACVGVQLPCVIGVRVCIGVVGVACVAAVEVALRLAGVGGERRYDPFAGFSRTVPMFEPATRADGTPVFRTAKARRVRWPQEFLADKPANGFRVFVIGESSAAGVPYDVGHAFSAFLQTRLQAELPSQSVLEVNYTGSRGTHLFVPFTSLTPIHPVYWPLGRNTLTGAVPNPFYGVITDARSQLSRPTVQLFRLLRNMPHFDGADVATSEPPRGDSNYHALQLKWEKRYSNGLTMLAHYTWSKMIDNISHSSGNVNWLGGGTNLQNPFDLRGERSLSSHDAAHATAITGAYELPFGKSRKWGSNWNRWVDWLAGGWEVSAVARTRSGMPLHVTQSGGSIWNGTQRPDLVGDPSTSGSVQSRLAQWFNQAAFAKPATDVPGTAPRNLKYRGPAINTFNAALLKSFATVEGQRLEFRLEADNAFNHPIFSDPGTSYGSTGFGSITGTKVGPRNMQIG